MEYGCDYAPMDTERGRGGIPSTDVGFAMASDVAHVDGQGRFIGSIETDLWGRDRKNRGGI